MVSHTGRAGGGRRGESRPETPRAETPLWQHPPVTACAYMAEWSAGIETVAVAATPGTQQHAFGDWLTAIGAPEDNGDDCAVAFDKRYAAHLLPVKFLPSGGYQDRGKLELFGNGLEQGRAHLFRACEPLIGINRQGLL